MAAMDRSKLLAWLFVVVFLVCSCAAPAACSSSRPPGSGSGSGSGGASRGGREALNRRLLGFRSPWSPPAPLGNTPTTMTVPPPPWT
ncbi:hypothetical protein PVAP13_4KG072333 [Panicum virgatum]|uniref:Uncharacterized protein n=1 Tax=Panicum virgatum TaxID=38727 RepID=A0A8T0TI11_PANVG|nr:hypothetical protein PVAP13_4KG072333 [Panicum virgatum]